ncbi:MAG: protein kinase domain-containing protein [Acidobacteriota bacterium]
MILQSGARLGPYEIVAPIGAGGMGEVYRARDTRLDRLVAIKILSADFAEDARLRVRFEREAKTISALNHPHICTLHDLGRENGIDYLVMEHCEGKTLAKRIEEGLLPVAQVMEYGIQIADALDKAHQQGIVHRDLKPSNIMLTKSGVKLLDFGLAKHSVVLAGNSPSVSTMEKSMTEEGMILGTIHYMAPELFEGKEADARSDVFALGLVLYEMLTGKQAFSGASKAGVIAAILEREPARITALQPIPDLLERLVESCLAKDPDQRIQSAHDIKLQLEWHARARQHPIAAAQVLSKTKLAMWTVAAAALAVVGTIVIQRATATKTEFPAGTLSRTVADLRGAPNLALGQFFPRIGFFNPVITLSHDGTLLVYVGFVNKKTQLFKRRLDSYEVEPIPGTEGANYAFFSPDDSWIGFLTDDKVMKAPLAGGSPVTLADATSPNRAVWLAGGTIIVGDDQGARMMFLPEKGGQTRLVNFDTPGRFNDVLPDGRGILVSLSRKTSGDYARVSIFDLEDRSMTEVLDGGYDARYAAPGVLLFVRGNDLHAVRFDVKRRQIVGEAVTLQSAIATESFFREAHYSVTDAGVLAYVPGNDRSVGRIAWVDEKGNTDFLRVPDRAYSVFDLSPDGRTLAIQVSDVLDYLWIFDITRGEGRRLPASGDVISPRWSPDSREIISGLGRGVGQPYEIVKFSATRSEPVVVHSSQEMHVPSAISPDGQLMGLQGVAGSGFFRVGVKRIGEASPIKWFRHHGWGGDFSPDGRWFAFASNHTGRYEIWIHSIDTPDDFHQISVDGGVEPVWCRNSGELFYRSGARWYAVRISTEREPKWEAPRLVWETDFIDTWGTSYDVSPDGKRLLVSKRTSADVTDRIHLIQNWRALLPKF